MRRILIIGKAEFVLDAPSIESDQMPAHNGRDQVMLIALPEVMLLIKSPEIEIVEIEEDK